MKRPTRWYSSRQEKQVAKEIGGKQVSNSGATPFNKGDVRTDNWLIECKTKTKDSKMMNIKQEWLDKLKEEAFAMGKPYYALSFNFGPDKENYYIINSKLLKELKNILESY